LTEKNYKIDTLIAFKKLSPRDKERSDVSLTKSSIELNSTIFYSLW